MRVPLLLALAATALLAGCASSKRDGAPPPPPKPPKAYRAATLNVGGGGGGKGGGSSQGAAIRRVALLPIFCESVAPESLRDVERAFYSELTKDGYFEVVSVQRAELESFSGERQLSSVRTLPADLLEKLRDRFGADGLLFIDITHYSPYRPVSIGVRTKLVDTASGRIQWAVDHVYDTGNPAVAGAAKAFQQQFANDQRALPDDGGSVLLSPARFARYVAAETFSTLRPGGG